MGKVKYEYDIKQKSIEFSLKLLKYLNGIEKRKVLLPIIDQLVRSGTSVGANIHEAQTSQSTKEMMRYYRIALKSANESNYWFILLGSLGDDQKVIDELNVELNN
jgi:four helix bundle protein